MLKAAGSVEAGGLLTMPAESTTTMKPAPANTRFAYATGSRPLDGYTIKRGVGAGGFGEVYFAVSDAGKEVALKRIQRNLDVELRGVSQCLNLKHPHLVAIYDIRYDEEGQAWVVMEYVRGECLKDVIDRNPNGLPLPELVDWFRGLSSGVGCLHEHGIVHRDLKPGNVFLDEGVVKIGDYGLSKYISCSRRSGQTESVGTFHYMAPEIGRGVYGKEIDIYALGVILYELLTGRVPFDGESSHEIIMKHLTALPDVSGLPEMFRPIIQRALLKDPGKRYGDVGEMLAAVERAAGAAPSSRSFVAAAAAQARPTESSQETYYLGPEAAQSDMQFGPLYHVATAEVVPDTASSATPAGEPIAAAMMSVAEQFSAWWSSPALNRTARVLLAMVFIFLFFTNAGWIIPLAIVLSSLYLVYYGIRAIFLSLNEPASAKRRPTTASRPVAAQPAAARPAGASAAALHPEVPDRGNPMALPVTPRSPMGGSPIPIGPVAHPLAGGPNAATPVRGPAPKFFPNSIASRQRRRFLEVAREQLARKPLADRLTEVTGSMLVSALVATVVSYLGLLVAGHPVDGSARSLLGLAWLAGVSTLASWIILVPAKFSEGVEGESVQRRFSGMLAGLLVGGFAYLLASFLGVSLREWELIHTPPAWRPPSGVFALDGSPLLPGFLGFFGGLFLAVRWWLQADPLRSSRISIWTTVVVFLTALLWQVFWPFPQPWSLLVPVTVSLAVQFSASWMSTAARTQLRRAIDQGHTAV